MTSTDATNLVIDLQKYRGNLQKNGLVSGRSRCTAQSSIMVDTPLANVQVELRVELDNLARSLLKIRKWLTDYGCSRQVFHCVKAGSEAVITVKFDTPRAGVIGKFYKKFGAGS